MIYSTQNDPNEQNQRCSKIDKWSYEQSNTLPRLTHDLCLIEMMLLGSTHGPSRTREALTPDVVPFRGIQRANHQDQRSNNTESITN